MTARPTTIAEAIEQVCQPHLGKVLARESIVKWVVDLLGCPPSSVMPSDYCYNRTNAGVKAQQPMFEMRDRGSFLFLGRGAPYTGTCMHYPRSGPPVIVGEWVMGEWRPRPGSQDMQSRRTAHPQEGPQPPVSARVSAALPLADLRHALFVDETGASKVCKEYALPAALRGDALEQAMFDLLEQEPRASNAPPPTNREVFRAAVLALASNSRAWTKVLANRDLLASACGDFDPAAVTADPERSKALLTTALSGQTRSNDVTAVVAWAEELDRPARYSDYLDALVDRCHAIVGHDHQLTGPQLTALVACIGGFGITTSDHPADSFGFSRKFAGMQGALGSEFLRNLGWPGFKPDRHVMRLLDAWIAEYPEWQAVKEAAERDTDRLMQALGRRSQMVRDFLFYSRLGELLTPHDTSVTRADQLVWLYGSQVATKRRQPRPRR